MLDIVLGVIVLGSVGGAAFNGLTKELLRIASLVVGLLVAMWGYGVLADYLVEWIPSAKIASVAAFALLMAGCLLAGALLARLLAGIWSIAGLGLLDRLLGAVFGALRGLLLAAALLLALVAFQPLDGTTDVVADSRIAPIVLNLARTAAVLAPESLRDAFLDGLELVGERLPSAPQSASSRRRICRPPWQAAKPEQGPFRLSV
ncbi:MAG: CvpA family protein [Bryobacterales bacterium]|nr:CvpA family protein [Bryobacterales bacterium]